MNKGRMCTLTFILQMMIYNMDGMFYLSFSFTFKFLCVVLLGVGESK